MLRLNMRRSLIYTGIAFLLCGVFAQAYGQGAAREFQMTAKDFEFTPRVIEVSQGDHIKLTITALDRDHGFALPAFGIKQRLKKGAPTVIEFDADKAGTFPFHCSVFCGMGHRHMKGTIIVRAN